MKQYSKFNIMMTLYPYNSNNLVHMMYGFDYGFFRPHIIALTGSSASHSTRECIARHLVKKYSYHRLDFNDPVKTITKELFNYTEQEMNSEKLDWKYNITPKQAHNFIAKDILQHKIQELLPEYDKRFLAQHLITRMQTHARNKRFIISDLLYYHEYQELARYDPFIIRVDDKNKNDEEYKMIPYNIKVLDCGTTDEKKIVRKLNYEFQKLSE